MPKSCIHPEISDLFVPYLNGQASRKEARELEEHLTRCVICQEQIGIVALIATYGGPGWKRRNNLSVIASLKQNSEAILFRQK